MDRWTMNDLKNTDDILFAIAILNERKKGLNPYSPLSKKISEAVNALEMIRKEKEQFISRIALGGLECYIKGPWEDLKSEEGRDHCTKPEGSCEYQILADRISTGETIEKKAGRILLRLHDAGGCDAQDDRSKGWDEAITEAIRIIEEETGLGIEQVLE